jgi:Domain of unknown function (DU1801)
MQNAARADSHRRRRRKHMATAAKTVPTAVSVADFLGAIEDPERRADCAALVKLMQAVTGEKATMWGPSIVGFGTYHYVYDSGRSGDAALTGFSPRKGDISIYIVDGLEHHAAHLARLGPHKTGKVCLYVKRLADIDMGVLKALVEDSVKAMAPQRVAAKKAAAA